MSAANFAEGLERERVGEREFSVEEGMGKPWVSKVSLSRSQLEIGSVFEEHMEIKRIKFRNHLVKLILAGEKDLTRRLFDDKNLNQGDIAELINWNTGETFGKAELTDVREKKIGELVESDFDGHEKFVSEEEMYNTYRTYYGDKVGPDTVVKMIRFKLL